MNAWLLVLTMLVQPLEGPPVAPDPFDWGIEGEQTETKETREINLTKKHALVLGSAECEFTPSVLKVHNRRRQQILIAECVYKTKAGVVYTFTVASNKCLTPNPTSGIEGEELYAKALGGQMHFFVAGPPKDPKDKGTVTYSVQTRCIK